MNIFLRIMQALQLAPLVVQTVESLKAGAPGAQKAQLATQLVMEGTGIAEILSANAIDNPEQFNAGMQQVNDGVVAMLNAAGVFKHNAPTP